ncbi:MAG: hypothetical protein ACXW1Y_10025 [Acidimicrobiia bacterium]
MAGTVTCLLAAPTAAVAAEEVTVGELIEFAEELAGVDVDVEGELVGDYGFRNDGWMWTQLNGDPYVHQPIREEGLPVGPNTGIGVRMPTELAQSLGPPGGYRTRGPVVRLTGIWKYHDPARQGESYLEVSSLDVIESGRGLDEQADWRLIVVGVFLLVVTAVIWYFRPRE